MAQKPDGLRPGATMSSLARERPRRPATLHQQAPAAEDAWAEVGYARGCASGAPCRRGIPGNADETCGALRLATLPQPVSRQPDVTGLYGD
jgi:hypothetical protein